MRKAHVRGVLVGVESVTPDGLKDIHKGFNATGEALVTRLRAFRDADVHVLGSFIFGLASDRPETFAAAAVVARRANLTFAQFLMLTPLPGTIDFARWEQTMAAEDQRIGGVPVTRPWLIPPVQRPRVYMVNASMSPEEIRSRTAELWRGFYSVWSIWRRSRCVRSLRGRMVFVLVSVLYHRRYASTGIVTDSVRVEKSLRWGRLLAKPCQRLFAGRSMPDLPVPVARES